MGTVLHWPKHLRYHCPPGQAHCIEGRCMICSGGLFSCVRCLGAEGSLPTECPGSHMTMDYQEEVMAGTLDFTLAKGWHTPKGYRHGK